MKNKRILYNLLVGVMGQVIAILLGLFLPRFFITGFGSEVNGLLSSISQIYVYINLLEAGVGSATLQALYKPISTNSRDEINSILSATSIYYRKTGFMYLLAIILFSLSYPLVVNNSINYLDVVLIIFFTGFSGVFTYFFQGKYKILLEAEGKNYILLSINTLINILSALVKIILIVLGYDVVIVQVSFFIVNLIQLVVIEYIIRKDYGWLDLRVKPNFSAISQKSSVLIHQLSFMIFSNTDILILTFFTNLKIVSVYTVYNLFFKALNQILSIINSSATFALGQMYNKDKETYKKMVDVNEFLFFILSFILYTTLIVGFIPFLKLYTRGFPSDVNYIDYKLAFLFLLIEIVKVVKPVMNSVVSVAGHFKQTQNRALIEMAINLLVSLVGVYYFGIYGVLLGTIIALAYRSNDFVLYVNNNILKRSSLKTYLRFFINIILLGLILLISNNFVLTFNTYVDAILTYFIIFIGVSISYLSLNCLIFKDDLRILLTYIKSSLPKFNK